MTADATHVISLGYLSHEDPLYGYFQCDITPRLGFGASKPVYRVSRFSNSSNVYLYEEENRGFRMVGKFFKSPNHEHNGINGEREFNNLMFLRGLGFLSPPHYVVKPYGYNPEIGNLVVTEFIDAESLSKIINDAIYLNNHRRLFKKLSALAGFLAAMHNRTAGDETVNFHDNYQYMGRLLTSMIERWGMGSEYSDEFYQLREVWRARSFMWEDRAVIVHGDATPSNILLGHGSNVILIDLERMKWTDRVFDLGRLCGELKHFFFRGKGDPYAAEPFIGHFLWEYSGHFPEHESAFRSITKRIPFYMGITLLRIARNSWIDRDYRLSLVREAKQILRANI